MSGMVSGLFYCYFVFGREILCVENYSFSVDFRICDDVAGGS